MINKLMKENKMILELDIDLLVASKVKTLVEEASAFVDSEDNYSEVILDLSNVKIIDSMGITFVIGLFKNTINNGRTYKVTGINSDIEKLFKLMKLDEVIQMEQ